MIISRHGKMNSEDATFAGECKACGCAFHIDAKRSVWHDRFVFYEMDDVLANLKLICDDGPDYFLCDCPDCCAPFVKLTLAK